MSRRPGSDGRRRPGALVAVLVAALFAAGPPSVASARSAPPVGSGSSRPGAGSSSGARPTASVVVDATTAQEIQGFGASGAWWPNDLVRFPSSVQRRLAAMLFGNRGIALSGYRYNVGGGGLGVTNPVRAPQSFRTPAGHDDWQADPGGRAWLGFAAAFHVPQLTAFANSAPPVWTTNGKSCGGSLLSDRRAVRAYAAYLATVVRHLRTSAGITISYVSPMNEPDNSFPSCGQEGMSVPTAQRRLVVDAVARQLKTTAPWARVVADESATATLQLTGEASQWLLVGNTAHRLAAVSAHGYDFPSPSQLAAVHALGVSVGTPIWMTEVCCEDGQPGILGFGPQYDPTMTSGTWLADTIWQDLTVAGESAFYWWTAASSALGCDPLENPSCATSVNGTGWNDGLVYYDPNYASDGNHRLYTTKRYYVLGNFSRYVRPGAVRHPTVGDPVGLHSLAFSHGNRWTVVLVDDQPQSAASLGVQLEMPVPGRWTGAVVTSSAKNLAPSRIPTGSPRHAVVHLTPESVTTLEFRSNLA